jgi:hypothetical protein
LGISRRLRYEVLRRDSYTCRYCGAKAPDVEITVDHVIPVALGGTDEPSNLVAACGACNGGKTSSSPDAPLVAEVADRALEWAQAMRQAQAKMLADVKLREADREQFREWWDGWRRVNGDSQTQIPKDPAWWVTVDQLIVAGLPLPVLKGCIDLAMTQRKVKDENRFRYMCGVAWNKVKELQKAARAITSGEALSGDAGVSDPLEEGRLSLARELLDEISEEERAHFLEAADMTGWQDEDDEPQTESQHACEAVSYLLNSARCNVDWLVGRIRETLGNLPAEVGQPCLAEMVEDETLRDPISRMAWTGVSALYALEDLIDLPAATAWTYEVSEDELTEWLVYARALYGGAEVSDERWLARAWTCARVVAKGRFYTAMCRASGEHIRDCPARGTHYAQIAELACCGSDRAEDHPGHLVCERHLEQLVDGIYVSRDGETFSATDFTEVPAPKDVWAAA